jgi:hypothetical protein
MISLRTGSPSPGMVSVGMVTLVDNRGVLLKGTVTISVLLEYGDSEKRRLDNVWLPRSLRRSCKLEF